MSLKMQLDMKEVNNCDEPDYKRKIGANEDLIPPEAQVEIFIIRWRRTSWPATSCY